MRVTISSTRIWLLVFIAMGLKIVFYIYYKSFIMTSFEGHVFGGGNDADYYNDYALGYVDFAANYWPVILRFLNENELYNRYVISLILFVTSLTLTPYIYYKMVKIQANEIKPVMAGSFFLTIYYPTLFYLTVDIYREVFMFTILFFSLLIYKKILGTNSLRDNFYLLIYLSLAYFLYLMRPYLGFALGLTPFIYLIFSKTKRYFKTWIIIYFVTLVLINITGALDQILSYREHFRISSDGGSTLGIELLDKNPIIFIFYYIYSLLLQLFGLFLFNINAVFVFFLETIPFILAFIYLLKNVKFMSKFVIFLLTFFTIYTTVWLLGNDNLGTAVRLRIPSYLVIFACMFIIYQTKVVVGYEKIKRKKLEI